MKINTKNIQIVFPVSKVFSSNPSFIPLEESFE